MGMVKHQLGAKLEFQKSYLTIIQLESTAGYCEITYFCKERCNTASL